MTALAASVVMPVFNGARQLGAALDSILSQRRRPQEIIVVDDGSTDQTHAIIASYGDRVIALRQDNLGPAGARNAGIARATAPVIAFLDADDLWLATALADQLDCLETHPDAGAAWGLSERAVSPGVAVALDDWHGQPQWSLSLGAIAFRRDVFESVGVFDPTLRCGEDLDLMIRLAERHVPVIKHRSVVELHRYHGDNHFSLDAAVMTAGRFGAVARAMARRRLAHREVAS